MKTYSLTNIENLPSRNGYSMTCTLLINATPVCDMQDFGDGSQPDFKILDKKLFAELQNDLENLPEVFMPEYDCKLKIDTCMFIDMLHYAIVNKTEFKLLAA